MRYINFSSFTPSNNWQTKSQVATAALMRLSNTPDRLDFIKAKAQVWRDLREELIDKFGSRCWFTDAEETVAQLDIEHFRPKAEARDEDETVHEGYWWLAFEITNLRLAGQIPNRQKKRCYFPLLPGSVRASPSDPCWREELPLFLDPTKLTDVELVAYSENGEVCSSTNAITEEEKRRVRVTDRLLGLSSHEPLLEARRRIWNECREIMNEILRLKEEETAYQRSTARTKGERERLMRQLFSKARPAEPFSSITRCCLRMSGYDWAAQLAE